RRPRSSPPADRPLQTTCAVGQTGQMRTGSAIRHGCRHHRVYTNRNRGVGRLSWTSAVSDHSCAATATTESSRDIEEVWSALRTGSGGFAGGEPTVAQEGTIMKSTM